MTDPGRPDALAADEGPARAAGASTVGRSALAVGGGILLSRVTGFARDVAIGAFFGTGLAASAYNAALRIPNVVRNLLGEGTLSASFVPVYSAMLEEDRGAARRLARGVLGLVIAVAGVLSALGVLLAPLLTRVVVPGWSGEAAALTTSLVRVLFPMAGIMIVAAWCLGVLNSHRRFFLPFAAPVLWNLAQIAGLFVGDRAGWEPLVHVLAWSTLAGSVLQLAVQLPEVVRLLGRFRPSLEWSWEPARRVIRNAGPVVSSQGIFQVSSLLDLVLASALPTAAIAGLYYAQRLAYLPLSLFGVSVATAALPEMSRDAGTPSRDAVAGGEGGRVGAGADDPGGTGSRGVRIDPGSARADLLRRRLRAGFFQILWFVFPAALAFVLFGDLIVALLFQRGEFGPESTALVTAILMAYSVGLVASSSVKLFAGGFHALQDTRTPLELAAVAVATGVGLGAAGMFAMKAAGFGAVSVSGLVLGGAVGYWVNLALLWRGLASRVGRIFRRGHLARVARVVGAAAVAGGLGHLARGWLEARVAWAGLPGRAAVLAGTLVAAGVPYLLTAGRPPSGATGDGRDGTDTEPGAA